MSEKKKCRTFADRIESDDLNGLRIHVRGRWFRIGNDTTSDRPRRDKLLLELFVSDIIKRQSPGKVPKSIYVEVFKSDGALGEAFMTGGHTQRVERVRYVLPSRPDRGRERLARAVDLLREADCLAAKIPCPKKCGACKSVVKDCREFVREFRRSTRAKKGART